MSTDDSKPTAESDEKMVTIYLTPAGYAKAEKEFSQLEKEARHEVALGTGDWVNVYTTDTKAVVRVVDFLGKENVIEIA